MIQVKTGGTVPKDIVLIVIKARMDHYKKTRKINLIYLLLIFVCLRTSLNLMKSKELTSERLRITAWNLRGLTSASIYLKKLFGETDILVLNEHNSYECDLHKLELLHSEFTCLAKSSRDLNISNYGKVVGHSGVAVLWRKCFSASIRPLPNLGSDRICVIEISMQNKQKLYVIGVYLPHRTSVIADFETELIELENLIKSDIAGGAYLIIGDWNCHFGESYGSRCWGKESPNAELAVHFIERCVLSVVDVTNVCTGPNYTYINENGYTAFIDHRAVSASLLKNVNRCTIHEDELSNTSDHLPVFIELDVQPIPTFPLPKRRSKIKWSSKSESEISNLYSVYLDQMVEYYLTKNEFPHDYKQWTKEIVEKAIEMITLCMKVASSALPKTKALCKAKSYWTKDLSSSSKEKKQAWRQWVMAGRPKSDDNFIWITYKKAKKQFQQEQRQAQYKFEQKCVDDIEKAGVCDQRQFWHMVNKYKKKSNLCHPVKRKDGSLVTDPCEISNLFRSSIMRNCILRWMIKTLIIHLRKKWKMKLLT